MPDAEIAVSGGETAVSPGHGQCLKELQREMNEANHVMQVLAEFAKTLERRKEKL